MWKLLNNLLYSSDSMISLSKLEIELCKRIGDEIIEPILNLYKFIDKEKEVERILFISLRIKVLNYVKENYYKSIPTMLRSSIPKMIKDLNQLLDDSNEPLSLSSNLNLAKMTEEYKEQIVSIRKKEKKRVDQFNLARRKARNFKAAGAAKD